MVQKDSFDGARPCKSKDALNSFNCQDRTTSQWLPGCATNELAHARLAGSFMGAAAPSTSGLQIQILDSGESRSVMAGAKRHKHSSPLIKPVPHRRFCRSSANSPLHLP